MSLLKLLKFILLGYVYFFPALAISYIFWTAIWALKISSNLYVQSDPVIFLTDFIPPFVNPHYDHYLSGVNEAYVMRLWYLFIILIIVTAILLSLLVKKYLQGLKREVFPNN